MSTPDTPTPPATRATTPAPRRRKSRTSLILVLAAIIVAALVAGAIIYRKRGNNATRVTIEKAAIRNITQIVMATGRIQPEVEVKIAPEVSGEVTAMPFREGASVNRRDIIAQIKPDNYQFLVEQQQAALDAARARALEAEVQLARSREDFKRAENLHNASLLSDSDFTAARTALDAAQAALDLTQDQYGKLKTAKNPEPHEWR